MIGQHAVVRILKAVIRKKEYEAAYMFSGPSGVGKTTLGRIFAKAVLCESPVDGNPCCKCDSCISFQQEANFGYKELDAASYGGKEDMVRIRDDASYQSVSKKKIILIDECHDVSKAGQDALLKQLEQCPEHLIYIFCTTEPEKMKSTVRGRCTEYQISRVEPALVLNRLKDICIKEEFGFQEDALKRIVDESNGQVRDAIGLLEEVSYLGEVNIENLSMVSKNYDTEIFAILSNLGTDLKTALEAARKISAVVPVREMYGMILSMLSDAAKMIYGTNDFEPQRKVLLEKLKDLHGYALLEFLNYLINRDKFVDRIGLQSDIVLLHYKFGSQSFKPQSQTAFIQPQAEQKVSVKEPSTDPTPPQERKRMSHAELSKLSVKERNKMLREQRRNKNAGEETKESEERVPKEWPLPKEQRIGESSFDEEELSPEHFSNLLVGGRSGG